MCVRSFVHLKKGARKWHLIPFRQPKGGQDAGKAEIGSVLVKISFNDRSIAPTGREAARRLFEGSIDYHNTRF